MEWIASHFWFILKENERQKKRKEKGATKEVFLPPVTPGSTILP